MRVRARVRACDPPAGLAAVGVLLVNVDRVFRGRLAGRETRWRTQTQQFRVSESGGVFEGFVCLLFVCIVK